MAPEPQSKPGAEIVAGAARTDAPRRSRRPGRGHRGRGRRGKPQSAPPEPDAPAPDEPIQTLEPARPVPEPEALAPAVESPWPSEPAEPSPLPMPEPLPPAAESPPPLPVAEPIAAPLARTAIEEPAERPYRPPAPPPQRHHPPPGPPATVEQAIEHVNQIIGTLRETLEEMEEVLELLEVIERQNGASEHEIESLRRSLRQLQHPRDSGHPHRGRP